MSKKNANSHPKHDGHKHSTANGPKRPIHHDWRLWVAVVLMLAAMGAYVATMDEAIVPGEPVGEEVPAAAE